MNRVPLPHDSAHTHVTGQSEYVDDRPLFSNEIYIDIFYSTEPFAKIKKLNLTRARAITGVLGIFTAKDFVSNVWGTIFKDQPLLADTQVQFAGEPIALIAAETTEAARRARDLIQIHFETSAPILSIDEAKRLKSFIGPVRKIERGHISETLQSAPHRIAGKLILRGADHFYLESQVAIAYPKEDGQIEVHSSSQHPTEVQHVVSHALGLSAKDVVCFVKRMGGAFGGKESQAAPIAAYAALVAQRLKRPARIVLTKDDDMIITGKRNPFENIYRVGFDSDGKILALDVELYSDGGAYADLSTSIMERAMLHCDNAYFIPHIRITGQVCKTHHHPHTAFRGFGGPKGVATIERIIEEIAHFLKVDALKIRKLNCYQDSQGQNTTPYGQKVENNCLPQIFDQLERESEYEFRKKAILEENKNALGGGSSRLIRGLSLTAVKFGISFTTRFLNQANALVLIHRDGSIQAATGATEMGQGVNARIAEILSQEFGLPRDRVRIMATATDKNANTSPTAASSGTDLNGAAAVIAARKIKMRLSELASHLLKTPERLWARNTAGLGSENEIQISQSSEYLIDPNQGADFKSGLAQYHDIVFDRDRVFFSSKPEHAISFSALINEAYLNRISLTEYAHYRFPGLSFNKLTGQGQPFLYFTQGVAASEVSVNLDTGEVKVLRVDILMDLGRPVNRALDMGQVYGWFIQGMV
ncbi:MAG: molybdopterin cofactor-binding domain-containing protein, partial [Bdellovibrionota bacterium]